MAKLVILSQGLVGRTHELKVDKTTIGRVEDNTFPITEPSVSSHHCEILLRGTDVVVKDLDSTNGTFINGEKISESVLKPGQILRLGQIEMRLETDSSAPSATKPAESTMVMSRGQGGVSLTDLEQASRGSFDTSTSKGFTKKTSQGSRLFLIVAIVVGVVIAGLIFFAIMSAK